MQKWVNDIKTELKWMIYEFEETLGQKRKEIAHINQHWLVRFILCFGMFTKKIY